MKMIQFPKSLGLFQQPGVAAQNTKTRPLVIREEREQGQAGQGAGCCAYFSSSLLSSRTEAGISVSILQRKLQL